MTVRRPSPWILSLFVVGLPSWARAHGGELQSGWFGELSAAIPLALCGIAYAAGLTRLWRRAGIDRGVRAPTAALFVTGWLSLVLVLCSPVAELARETFVGHMLEHEWLMLASAPLLVLGRPLPVFLFALPRRWRSGLAPTLAAAGKAMSAHWPALPLFATVLHAFALWIGHFPAVFEAALHSELWHAAQHVAFLGTAILFWWSVLSGAAERQGVAVFCLFVTSLHCGLLGLLLALANEPWVPAQSARAMAYGLTPVEDQQLAGLVMWVPGGLVFAAVALACAAAWIRTGSHRHGEAHAALDP